MLQSSVRRMSLAVLLGALAACESPTKPPPPVASVVVGPGLALVDAGGTAQFGVTVSDANGRRLEGRAVTWEILDTVVGTISSTGLVTSKPNPTVADRNATVRATVDGIAGQSTVSVRPSVVTSLTLSPYAPTLQDGDAPTLTVQARDAANNLLVGRTANFSSRDVNSARVSSAGVLTPVPFLGGGNRAVRIVANIGSVYDSITVNVAPTELSEIQIFPAQPFLQPGWTKTLRTEGRTPSGNPVVGFTPTYSSSNTAIATVNASGVVTALPAVAGTSQVIANFGEFADTVTVTVDACGAAPIGTYPLQVRFFGPNPPTPSVQAAFDCAAARIGAIIRLPVAATNINNPSMTGCTGEATAVNETAFTGLIIYAKVDTIDGPGQVLGSAGPCYVRSTSRLPLIGVMNFDDDDLAGLEADGRLLAVIMHEMLHVVGIGTSWRDNLRNPLLWTGDVANPGFLGVRAREACVNSHGGSSICVGQVPIEDCVGIPGCGSGTRLGHWRELIFRRELMTGYVSAAGQQNPFSRMTIEALADLGYSVDPDQSNDYVIPPPSLMSMLQQGTGSRELRMPAPRLPTHEIDPMGRARPIVR